MTKAKNNSRLLKKVEEVYEWLDLQISNNSELAGQCRACGQCCDFENFDHHLFVTPPEVMYLTANLDEETINPPNKPTTQMAGKRRIKPMTTSRCPYNIDGKCSVYKYRFAGCRIFYCRGDSATRLADKKDFQSELSESALKKFKTICTELQIPYRYTDLATALSSD